MSSFGRQFSPSPVLIMSPQPAHQSPLGMASFTRHAPPRSFGAFANQFASARPSAAGRKRCRDEASENLEPDAVPPPVEEPEEEWVYGPGMVLIKPSSRYVTDASSQSGTWIEEQKAAEESSRRALEEEKRVSSRNHKSQRTALSTDGPTMTTLSPLNTSSTKTGIKTNSPKEPEAPIIDNFTLHLGIGWRKISDDVDIQAAARGWARFIENHFPITNARILLESKGLQSYLVEASEGYFLFAENLRQGQLVSQTVEGVFRNLQSNPPTFDGAQTLVAAESPKAADLHSHSSLTDTEMKMD